MRFDAFRFGPVKAEVRNPSHMRHMIMELANSRRLAAAGSRERMAPRPPLEHQDQESNMKLFSGGGWTRHSLMWALFACGTAAHADGLVERAPKPKVPVEIEALTAAEYSVAVKFLDGALVRVTSGNQVSASQTADPTAIASVLTTHGLQLAPEFNLDPVAMDALIVEAQTRSGSAQPDWRGV